MNGDDSIVYQPLPRQRKQSHKNIRGAAVSNMIEKRKHSEKSFDSKYNIQTKQEMHGQPTAIPIYQFPQSSVNHTDYVYNQYASAVPIVLVPCNSMQQFMVVNSASQPYFYPVQLAYTQNPMYMNSMNSMNSLYSPVLSYSSTKNSVQSDSSLTTNESKLLLETCSSGSNTLSSPEVSCEGKNKVILEEDLLRK